MHYTTQPAARDRVHRRPPRTGRPTWTATPAVPVPTHRDRHHLSAQTTPKTADVARSSTSPPMLGATVTDDTRQGGHLTATRMFGPIGYTVVSIPATVMAAHRAPDSSTSGCVTP